MTLLQALMSQGHTQKEAQEIIFDMIEQVAEGENPEEVLEQYSLEPDYVMEII